MLLAGVTWRREENEIKREERVESWRRGINVGNKVIQALNVSQTTRKKE